MAGSLNITGKGDTPPAEDYYVTSKSNGDTQLTIIQRQQLAAETPEEREARLLQLRASYIIGQASLCNYVRTVFSGNGLKTTIHPQVLTKEPY